MSATTAPSALSEAAEEASPTVQSVDRAARILRLLAEHPALGVSEISRHLTVHRSTAFRLLATLEAHNLVEQEERRGLYRLGLGVLGLAGAVTHRVDLVRDAQAVCDQMAAQFNETTNVAILDDRAAVNVTQAMSGQLVAVLRQYVGQRTPLHATSTGKVLLAYAPTTLRESVLAGPLERFTPTTITDPSALRSELDAVRSQGWAAADAEWEADAAAVAVPVRGAQGDVVAALSMTAPNFRLRPETFVTTARALHSGAEELSRRLGHLPTRASSATASGAAPTGPAAGAVTTP